ncbi:hypothetical protein ACLOJK_026645 [Asimina triloba]
MNSNTPGSGTFGTDGQVPSQRDPVTKNMDQGILDDQTLIQQLLREQHEQQEAFAQHKGNIKRIYLVSTNTIKRPLHDSQLIETFHHLHLKDTER